MNTDLDSDLEGMSRAQLVAEVVKLRAGILHDAAGGLFELGLAEFLTLRLLIRAPLRVLLHGVSSGDGAARITPKRADILGLSTSGTVRPSAARPAPARPATVDTGRSLA